MSDWDAWIDQARHADYLAIAQKYGAQLKHTSTAEWAGPCPRCGTGTDRFSINVKKRVCNCQICDLKGDVIAFVTGVAGVEFVEAIEQINGTPRPDRSRDETEEQREARLKLHAQWQAEREKREEEHRKIEEAKVKNDEEAVAKALDRALDLDDPLAAHGKAYLQARGLTPHRRLVGDIQFIPDLPYWGERQNGVREFVRLAILPAIVALIRDADNEAIGYSATYLDPVEPRKWTPTGSPSNSPTKIRGEKKGGLIHLGRIGKTLALGEGYANVLAWHQLGHGPEDITLAAAVDLGNLAAVNLPQVVRSVILVADNDSEPRALNASLRKALIRFQHQKRVVSLDWPPPETDWNDALLFENGRNSDAGKLRV